MPRSDLIVKKRLGYARWGGSGALYLQSAKAGLNPQMRPVSVGTVPRT